jgi:hypothetical protein
MIRVGVKSVPRVDSSAARAEVKTVIGTPIG